MTCEPGRRCRDVPAFRMSGKCQSNDVAAQLEVATSLGLFEAAVGVRGAGGALPSHLLGVTDELHGALSAFDRFAMQGE